jgi:hypothetical protein
VRRLGSRASHGSDVTSTRSKAGKPNFERRGSARSQAKPVSKRSRGTSWQPRSGAHVWLRERDWRSLDAGQLRTSARDETDGVTRAPLSWLSSLRAFCLVPATGISGLVLLKSVKIAMVSSGSIWGRGSAGQWQLSHLATLPWPLELLCLPSRAAFHRRLRHTEICKRLHDFCRRVHPQQSNLCGALSAGCQKLAHHRRCGPGNPRRPQNHCLLR